LRARRVFFVPQALLRLRDSHTAIAQLLKPKVAENAAEPAMIFSQAPRFFREVE
jgi:hypothetical protein